MHYEFVNVKMVAVRFRRRGSEEVIPRGAFPAAFHKLSGAPLPSAGAGAARGLSQSSALWHLRCT